jgi:hypothetical protein
MGINYKGGRVSHGNENSVFLFVDKEGRGLFTKKNRTTFVVFENKNNQFTARSYASPPLIA